MPRIPVYENTQDVNLLPSGMAHIDTPIAAFGKSVNATALQGLGNAGTKLGNQAYDYAIKQAEDDNILAAKNAVLSANDKVRDLMDNDILKRQGLAADNAVTDADSGMQKIYRDMAQNLNPAQQRIFDMQFGALRGTSLNTVSSYRRTQMNAADNAADAALLESYTKNALSNYTDETNYDTNLKQGMGLAASAVKKRTGADISPEAMASLSDEDKAKRIALYDAGVGDFKSKYHATIINQAIADGNLDWAKKNFEKYQSDFNPETKAKLETVLNTKVDLKAAQSFSDEVVVKYGISGEAEAKAFAEIPSRFSGEQRELVEKQVKAQFYDARRLKQQSDADSAENLMKQVLNTNSKTDALAIAEGIKDNPDVYVKVHQFLNARYGTEKKEFNPASYEKLEQTYKDYSDGKIDKGAMLQVYSECSASLPDRYTSHVWENIEEIKNPDSVKKSFPYKAGTDMIEKYYKDKKLYSDPAGLWNKRSSPEDMAINKTKFEKAYDEFFKANPKTTPDQAIEFVKAGTKRIQEDLSIDSFSKEFMPAKKSNETSKPETKNDSKEIKRMYHGKTAVFDSETKKFIRYE